MLPSCEFLILFVLYVRKTCNISEPSIPVVGVKMYGEGGVDSHLLRKSQVNDVINIS